MIRLTKTRLQIVEQITIEKLQDETLFTKLIVLKHQEIIPFVRSIFAKRNRVIRFFYAALVSILLVIIALAVWQITKQQITFGKFMLYLSLGLTIGFLPIIPIHEWIHGLAYKIVGAPSISYGGNLKQLYFYAVADLFVVDTKKFVFIALAPFVCISCFAIALALTGGLAYQWFGLGLLFIHTTACAGDFALLSFYDSHRPSNIYTYDDVANKISYFYARKSTTL